MRAEEVLVLHGRRIHSRCVMHIHLFLPHFNANDYKLASIICIKHAQFISI